MAPHCTNVTHPGHFCRLWKEGEESDESWGKQFGVMRRRGGVGLGGRIRVKTGEEIPGQTHGFKSVTWRSSSSFIFIFFLSFKLNLY